MAFPTGVRNAGAFQLCPLPDSRSAFEIRQSFAKPEGISARVRLTYYSDWRSPPLL